MANKAVFAGLIFDEDGNQVQTTYVGGEAFYIIDDAGFHRHIDAQEIDRPILQTFIDQLRANKDLAVPEALRMLGQDDLFTKAAVDSQIDNIDVDQIAKQGIPPQARDWIGMMGFKIIVNYRGEVVRMDQPMMPGDDE